ncbi:MAG: cytochrome c [Myxococcota bacterium]
MRTLALALAGCADPEPTCEVTWDNYAQGFFVGYCQTCHAAGSPDRHDAPAGVIFDTEADARRWAGAVRATVLGEAPTMPPGGGLTAEELELLDAYLACSAGSASELRLEPDPG